ncbi:MAG: sulfatase [Planctomycetota bacterium]
MNFCKASTAIVLALLISAPVFATERNVILFVTDDQGKTLGCYGDDAAHSPNLDQLAADGLIFHNAFATTASCSASRSVILSGTHNHKNGQYGHQHHFHKFAAFQDVISLSLPRALSRSGYRTVQIGKYHVAPEEVFHFDQYLNGPPRNAVAMAEACRELFEADSEQPFFLYFATSDPHRGGGVDRLSTLEFKPNMFGNRPAERGYPGVIETIFTPAEVNVPPFLSDTPETRAELAQYYQSCARVDFGIGRLIEILKETGQYEKTMIIFTSDHGMAFAGGKTTVYEPGLNVPFVVRNPYSENRGVESSALVSHVDITPTILDFAGALDRETNGPAEPLDADEYWNDAELSRRDNRAGGNDFSFYHGQSWLPLTHDCELEHHDSIFASHTFHEIQMYYPMRVYRDKQYKLIWNIAWKLDYPFASDLWAASSWQAQYQQGLHAAYGQKTVGQYIHRAEFELFDIANDPNETTNLATNPDYAELLQQYKELLKTRQQDLDDPWIIKWTYE